MTLAVIGGLGFWWLTKGGPDDADEPPIDVSPKGKEEDLDDPLAEARRIMDKYKK